MHGGRYSNFNTPSLVTHVVATNLCNAKLKATPNQVVVTPLWIVESVKASRRLPCINFILAQKLDSKQHSLHDMVASPAPPAKRPRPNLPPPATVTENMAAAPAHPGTTHTTSSTSKALVDTPSLNSAGHGLLIIPHFLLLVLHNRQTKKNNKTGAMWPSLLAALISSNDITDVCQRSSFYRKFL